jgi:GntR family transcriptional regulator
MARTETTFRPLDRESGVPFYCQIQQRFLEHIRSGALEPGESLPSEHEIARHFRVSRMTGRHALKALCNLGVTYTLWGKGTFVSGVKLEKELRQVTSFTEEMQALGLRVSSKLLSCEIMHPDEEITAALHLSRREELISIRRIRFANSSPMAVEWSRIPRRLCPDLLEKFQSGNSLYDTLLQHYGIRMSVAEEVVEAGLASAEDARLLKAPKRSPMFMFTRTSYVRSGEPVEFVKSVYRGDRYKIVNRLTRVNRELRITRTG